MEVVGDGECSVSGCSQKERTRSHTDLLMDEEQLGTHSDFEACSTKRLYQESNGLLDKKRQHSGDSGAEAELCGSESSVFLPAHLACVPQDGWEIREVEEIQDTLLPSCCTAEGSIDQTNPSSPLEYWLYPDDQHNMVAYSPVTSTIPPPATPVTNNSPCPFVPLPGSVSAIASTLLTSAVDPMVSSPIMTDTCSPIGSMCSSTGSAWDTLRNTSRSLGCSDQDPVSAAAHLHLLGESLSLIGHHLQETDKMVSVPSSLSLLLDSLLCALAPLICLSAEIPELRSCTQHTLASTMENIAYVMPGL